MITLVVPQSAEDYPKLVSFPAGVPEGVQSMVCTVQEMGTSTKKRKRKVIGELNGVQYQGMDYGDNSWRNNLHSYAVGVLDEETNEMTVLPADHIYVMKPYFPEKEKPVSSATNKTYKEKKESLVAEFGSKKKQRALRAAQSNIISTENISGAAAVTDLVGHGAQAEDKYGEDDGDGDDNLASAGERALGNSRSLTLPPFNEEAMEVENIYPIEGLIPTPVRTSLENVYDICITEYTTHAQSALESSQPDIFIHASAPTSHFLRGTVSIFESRLESPGGLVHSLLRTYIQSLVGYSKIGTSKQNQIRAKVCHLRMLAYAIRFHNIFGTTKDVATNEHVQSVLGHEAPQPLLRFFVDNYGKHKKSNGSIACQLTTPHRNKLQIYILVLALTLAGFNLDLDSLAKELRVEVARVSKLARECGCLVTKQKSAGAAKGERMSATLVAPVKFPSPKINARAKKG